MSDFLPHVTVATVVEDNGRFLLVEEWSSGQLVYNQPAGHLDPDETLLEAAVRETLEETGYHVELTGIVGTCLYEAPANGVTYYRTTFAGKALREEPNFTLDDGIVQAVWMTLDEMHAASAKMRSPLVIKTVEQYLKGTPYPLDLIY